ncbi:DUF4326 domain-containing protein [Paraburkholderia sp. SIMBA_054]|uniref:DUF4326 domain-containing protein n=1 Tax=Paraburkholderia sp. SIMBA_054 TaxID=3085795 RepID=UPI00397D48C9
MLNEIRTTNKYHGHWPNRRYVYIGRPSPLGNPFPIEDGRTREQAIQQYEQWLYQQLEAGEPAVVAELERIAGLVMDDTAQPVCLECFCSPKACHGDIIIQVIQKAIEANT